MSDESATADDLVRTIGDQIAARPVPAALIGMGLVWLFSNRYAVVNSSDRSSKRGSDDANASGEEGSSGRFATQASWSSTFPAAEGIAALVNRQPVLVGLVGLGLGAAVASAFRPTSMEAHALGQTSADLQARAGELASHIKEQAAKVADQVSSAVTDEASAQGLTVDGLSDAARAVGRKARSVIDPAAGGSATSP
jgi:hypothetical protein